ncbi:MAG: glycogen/starch synthase [Cyclonatronaceae bacterium]
MKILYAAAEISPFARLTNNADMLRFLPASLQDKGFEIRIYSLNTAAFRTGETAFMR